VFKIQQFAHFSRVSVKMLRHYDEIGLLKPAWVDPTTGYRYYAASQLPRLNRILALKDTGLRLEQIALLLDRALSPDEWRGVLKLRQAEIEDQLALSQRQLAWLKTHLEMLGQDRAPAFDILVREIPPQRVVSLRRWVVEDDEVTSLFEQLEAQVAATGSRANGCPLSLYFDTEREDPGFEVEVAVPVTDQASVTTVARELPGVTEMACLVYTGPYDQGPAAWQALSEWTERHQRRVTGPLREVYLRFGAHDPNKLGLPGAYLAHEPGQYVTELQAPLVS
jgi:DNA-binding transcriptional MerR regulator